MTSARKTEKTFQPMSFVTQSRIVNSVWIDETFHARTQFAFRDDRRARLVALVEIIAKPFDDAARLRRLHKHRSQERAQFLQRHAAHELAFVSVRNQTCFFGDDDDNRVRFLGQADRRAMARAERFVQIRPRRQRKNTRGIGDAVAFQNHAAVMDRVVRKKNRFQHFRRRGTIHRHTGLDGLEQLDGLLDGDERANFYFRKTFGGLHDNFNAFALLARAGKQRQVAKFGEKAAQFRLENNQDRENKKRRERAEQQPQNFQIQNRRRQRQHQQHDDETDDDRPAARPA